MMAAREGKNMLNHALSGLTWAIPALAGIGAYHATSGKRGAGRWLTVGGVTLIGAAVAGIARYKIRSSEVGNALVSLQHQNMWDAEEWSRYNSAIAGLPMARGVGYYR